MRRIKKAQIKWISLVPRGANRVSTLLKEESPGKGSISFEPLVKFADEEGILYAIVYAPELRDAQGEIASAEVVRDMAHGFALNGGKLDLRHDGRAIPSERAAVVESLIVQKGDPRFQGLLDYDGREVDPTGAWGVAIKLQDPELRSLYKSGKWRGVSMGGDYVEVEDEAAVKKDAERVLAALAKRLKDDEEEVTMTFEELRKALAEDRRALVKDLAKAVASGGRVAETGTGYDGSAEHYDSNQSDSDEEDGEHEQRTGSGAGDAHEGAKKAKKGRKKGKAAAGSATAEDGPDGAQLDGGTNAPGNARKEDRRYDLTKIEDVKALIHARKREQLYKELDTDDVDSLEQHLSNLEAAATLDRQTESVADRAVRLEKENRDLQLRVRKLAKTSAIPSSPTGESSSPGYSGLSKEDEDAVKAGEAMAKLVNDRRGFSPMRKTTA